MICVGCLGPVSSLYPEDAAERPIAVMLVSHGWHTGLVLEREHVLPYLPDSALLPAQRYLEFGWGDARYYPHPDPGLRELLSAALLPGPSVMHIVGMHNHPAVQFPASSVILLQLSAKGLTQMGRFLQQSLQLSGDDEALVPVAEGLYGDSIFVSARGLYMLPRTSNTWTASALRAAGLPITPAYALGQGNLMWQAERIGDRLQ